MLSTKDLRIGNFVFDKITSKYVRVKCLGNSTLTLNLEDGLRSVSDIELIDIKEEWLFNFGFGKTKSDMVVNGFEYNRQVVGNEDDVTIIGKDSTWFNACGVFNWVKTNNLGVSLLCKGNYVGRNFFKVHELQNVYYDLNGTDLPFSLVA